MKNYEQSYYYENSIWLYELIKAVENSGTFHSVATDFNNEQEIISNKDYKVVDWYKEQILTVENRSRGIIYAIKIEQIDADEYVTKVYKLVKKTDKLTEITANTFRSWLLKASKSFLASIEEEQRMILKTMMPSLEV